MAISILINSLFLENFPLHNVIAIIMITLYADSVVLSLYINALCLLIGAGIILIIPYTAYVPGPISEHSACSYNMM